MNKYKRDVKVFVPGDYKPLWPKLFTPDTYIWFHKLKKWVAWKPHIYAYWQGKYQPIEDEV